MGGTNLKINEAADGDIIIDNEERLSAFDLDIAKLKLNRWKMEGDESDYFNYGMNETMWTVFAAIECYYRNTVST